MVKSYEYESEVLKQLGYGSSTTATVDRPTQGPRANRPANEHPHGHMHRIRAVYQDEKVRMRPGPAIKIKRKMRIPAELMTAVRTTAICGAVCAFLIICITAHMRTVANDRQIQNLNIQIAAAQAEHEALVNALAVKSNQVALAARARHLGMVQNPEEMTVSLSYGQGQTSFGPQVADAE